MTEILNEDSRNQLLSKSKSSNDGGKKRFARRVKSRVANSVQEYNAIDMNKLFKEDVLTVNVRVHGETDEYIVRMSFGGFLEILRDQISKNDDRFDLRTITRALIIGFNKDDVYVNCSCPDFRYRFGYWTTMNKINSGDPENRPSNITNPKDALGSACKHVLLVLSNNSWLMKVVSVINNYTHYMEQHYQKAYADIIYPAIYGKEYEEPVQLTLFDKDELDTDADTIDKSNVYGKNRTQFQKGNTQGVRFASSGVDKNQTTLFDDDENNDNI